MVTTSEVQEMLVMIWLELCLS